MKKLVSLFFVLCLCAPLASQTPTEQTPVHRIRDKVRIVDADADFKVRIADDKSIVRIRPINGGPKLDSILVRAGVDRLTQLSDVTPMGFQEFEFVEQGEDFTVQFVEKDQTFSVKFVFDTLGALTAWDEGAPARDAAYAAQMNQFYYLESQAKQAAAPGSSSESSYPGSSMSSYSSSGRSASVTSDCRCKGIPLYGKVRVVNSYADFRVQVVDTYADLRVEVVNSYPTSCGKWQFVDSYADFTVQFVSSYPDFTITYVNSYAGQ